MRQSSSVYFSPQASAGGDPDLVYYNASITNNNANDISISKDPQVIFNETRQSPLIRDSSDYYFSIVRFTVNGASKNLPMWIPDIQAPQPVYLGNSSITVSSSQGTIKSYTNVVPNVGGSITDLIQSVLPSNVFCVTQSANTRISATGLLPGETLNVTFSGGAVLAIQSATGFTASPTLTGATSYTSPSAQNQLGNPNLTTLSLNIVPVYDVGPSEVETNPTQIFIEWVPENATEPVPPTPVLEQIFNTEYYYGYTFTHFCDLVNTAAETAYNGAWNGLVGLSEGAITKPTTLYPPKLTYDANTTRFSWAFDNKYWGDNTTGGTAAVPYAFKLYLNTNLEALLTNFTTTYFGGASEGKTNLVKVWNQAYFSPPDPATGAPFLLPPVVYNVITQDYNSTSGNWSPIESIVFTSSLIPISAEQVGAPNVFGQSDTGWSTSTSASAFQPVVTDIALGIDGAQDYRGFISYTPTAEYRMVSLSPSHQPITNIDIQVWWRNRLDNNLYPLRLYNNSGVSLKLMFRRKGAGM